MRAVLTRRGDYFVDLNKRSEIARKAKADLLVSVPADSFHPSTPRGASVWVLSTNRANREMGSEDFSYMLEARPGAYLFMGMGPGAGLHHPAYDFNDEAAPIGASFFARLVERALPL